MDLQYTKVRKVKSLSRAHATDAGIDFYVPEDLTYDDVKDKLETVVKDKLEIGFDENGHIAYFQLKAGQSVLIPTGIHVKLPAGHALIYFNKSGVASKKHLHVGACVVDENYQGECHINVTNVGLSDQYIFAGEKLVQGLIIPVSYCQAAEVPSLEELYSDGKSERGDGGFGSTEKKDTANC